MNKEILFSSHMAPLFMEYISPRYLKGTCPSIIINSLKSLDKFLVSINYNKDYLIRTAYDEWAKTLINLKPMTEYTYKSTVINFIQFLCHIGHDSFIPVRPKCPPRDFVPYIFSKSEIEKIFNAVDNLRVRPKRSTAVLMVMPALFRLLYSTGIRIGEALNIKNEDVDFERHIIILNKTKNKCQRAAPINASLEIVLRQYIKYRNKMPIKGIKDADSFFFISHRGSQISHGNAYDTFVKVIKSAGINRKSNHEGPNLHSIRHTACMHALKKLIDNGRDMYCSLPILSAFMGHKNVYDTEVYIHLTKEYYPDILEKSSVLDKEINNIISKAYIRNENE